MIESKCTVDHDNIFGTCLGNAAGIDSKLLYKLEAVIFMCDAILAESLPVCPISLFITFIKVFPVP